MVPRYFDINSIIFSQFYDERLPDELVVVEKRAVLDLCEGGGQLVDEALDAQVGVLVERQEVDSVEDVEDVRLVQLQRRQVLRTSATSSSSQRLYSSTEDIGDIVVISTCLTKY